MGPPDFEPWQDFFRRPHSFWQLSAEADGSAIAILITIRSQLGGSALHASHGDKESLIPSPALALKSHMIPVKVNQPAKPFRIPGVSAWYQGLGSDLRGNHAKCGWDVPIIREEKGSFLQKHRWERLTKLDSNLGLHVIGMARRNSTWRLAKGKLACEAATMRS